MSSWNAYYERERTKFGAWMDRNEITQGDLHRWSGASKPTITKLCGDKSYRPTGLIKRTVIASLNANGFNVDEYDFW